MAHLIALLFPVLLTTISAVKLVNFPIREIQDYRSYDDVTVLSYRIPEHVYNSTWNLTVWEVKRSVSISECEPRPLTAYIKHGSFPVVNPDGSKFPDYYYHREEKMYEVKFSSDKTSNFVSIRNPAPGDWFAIVFIDYTDPNDDEITQAGLTLVCSALMEASIDAEVVEEMTFVAPSQTVKHTLDQSTPNIKLQFFVPDNVNSVQVHLQAVDIESVSVDNSANIYIETSARFSHNATIGRHCTIDRNCTVTFLPSEHMWYYLSIDIDPLELVRVEFNLTVEYYFRGTEDCNTTSSLTTSIQEFPECWSSVPLTRQTYTGFFAYGFERTPFENGTILRNLQVRTDKPTILSYDVNPIQDIGGTFSLEIKIVMDSLTGSTNTFHVMVIACLGHELQMAPQFPDNCFTSTGVSYPSQLKVNSTSEIMKTNVQRLHVPFPEYGRWFLSLSPFCFMYNASVLTETPCQDLEAVNMTFILESDSCDPDNCGYYGRCYTHMNGGLLFSSCVCSQGYRGWGCTDDSLVTTHYDLLVATLLLTLSNLFFLPAIVMSIRNQYYTEALVYSFTMFFSTFYHACDAGEGVYSLCIFRSSVLQFCDFYSAVLAVWVTIIAMANLAPWLCSLAHMAGAIIIALGSEINRTSLWMFLIPTLIGLVILGITWTLRMRRTHSCYPSKKYWKYYLPAGLLLITVGLICYAFLQTARNYKFVHSFWHAVMALSILIIMPRRKRVTAARDADVEDDEEQIRDVTSVEEGRGGLPVVAPKECSKWSEFCKSIRCFACDTNKV